MNDDDEIEHQKMRKLTEDYLNSGGTVIVFEPGLCSAPQNPDPAALKKCWGGKKPIKPE